MAGALDALLGIVFSDGVEIELGGGLNFKGAIVASYNTTTGVVDIDLANSLASSIDYDNATSGLAASNVQDAIDELAASAAALRWRDVLATTGGNTTSGYNPTISNGDELYVYGDAAATLEGGQTARGTSGFLEVSRFGGGAGGMAITDGGAVAALFIATSTLATLGTYGAIDTRVFHTSAEVARFESASFTLATSKSLKYSGEASVLRGSNTVFATTSTETRLAAFGGTGTVGFYQTAARLGYFTNVVGDATAPALYIDAAFGAGTPRVAVSSVAGAGRDLIVAAGAGSAGNGGTLRLRPGAHTATAGAVTLEDTAGVVYLTTDITNAHLITPRVRFAIGNSSLSGFPELRLHNNLGPIRGVMWDGGTLYVGDASPVQYEGSSHVFREGGTTLVTLDVGRLTCASGVPVNWNGGTASLQRSTTPFLTYDGTTFVAPGVSATSSLWAFAQAISVTSAGAAVAGGGLFRGPAAFSIDGRNVANTQDVTLVSLSGDEVFLGEATHTALVKIESSATIRSRIGGASIVDVDAAGHTYFSGMRANWAGTTATLAVAGTTIANSTTSLWAFAQSVSITNSAAAVAGGGMLRGPNTFSAQVRNVGNTQDLWLIGTNASNDVVVGDGTQVNDTRMLASSSIRSLIGATLITRVVSTGVEYASTKAQNFLGDVLIQRNGADMLTSTAGVLNVPTGVHLNIVKSQALGVGAPATLGLIGGSGPTVAAQNKWVEVKSNGTTGWMAFWV